MFELIATIILVLSVLGIFVILCKKFPALSSLPKNGSTGIKKHQIILDIENKIREAHVYLFVKQVLLHKTLSFVKIWTLKLEVRLDHLLHGIRKKAQEIDKKTNQDLPK